MLCEYGCGQSALFTVTAKNKNCCTSTFNQCPAIKTKNGSTRGKNLTPNDLIFVENGLHSTEFVKARILKDELLEYICSSCQMFEWKNKKLVLELDHISGVGNDNRLVNLRLLCPNCHSQTPTFRGRGNSGKVKVSDELLLTSYVESGNIRQALITVGLAPKGGNYNRVMKLIAKSKGL